MMLTVVVFLSFHSLNLCTFIVSATAGRKRRDLTGMFATYHVAWKHYMRVRFTVDIYGIGMVKNVEAH